MTKENWIKHIEESTGLKRPSMGGDQNAWMGQVVAHRGFGCKECKDRQKTKNRSLNRKMHDLAMRDMGLVKVRGAVTGKIYWE